MGYVGKGLGSQPAMQKCWVRNRQCTRLSAMCCTYTQHTNAQHKHTHHTSVRASKHAYLYAHTCMQHTYAIMHTYMHTCIPSHDACRVRLLVLPIDDTDSANSACPKPRRAKSCRQPSSNQKHLDGKMYKTLTPLNPDPMRRCTTSLCSLRMPYCCCFFKAFANTQTPSGSEPKRLSRPQLVLATKFDRSASYMARTPLTPRMEPSKPRSRNTPSNTATPIRICASRVTELLRHTHHKSYSCNGAKH